MRFTKETTVTAFALFSMFFGAGNLILPPFLGYNAGLSWDWVTLGFALSAVVIPILGILAHARLQGTMLDFANKFHPVFSLVFCILVYMVSIALPAPRTASVTYEMGIMPYSDMDSITFMFIYFGLVLLFVLNRSKVLDLLGKYLTPVLIMMLFTIIGVASFGIYDPVEPGIITSPLTAGLLEGYQTFDAIGAVVVGAVLIVSLNLKKYEDREVKRKLIARGGILAGLGLLFIYGGLIYIGSLYSTATVTNSRTELLSFISYDTLGSGGRILLAILIGLACFTTAVGIVTGTADFVKGLFKGSQKAYVITAVLGSLIGVLLGQYGVSFIIDVAVPALYFIYPVTLILILLNVLPEKWTSKPVFRAVVITTLLFSIPDFLNSLGYGGLNELQGSIPFGSYGVGWLVPALIVFVIATILNAVFNKEEETEE